MIHQIILPKIEPNMEEALLVEWLKQENDLVKKGEPLFIIETAKTAIEVEAEESGILRKILVQEGETVPILQTIAFLGAEHDSLPEIKEQKETESKEEGEKNFPEILPSQQEPSSYYSNQEIRIKVSPAARRVARENNLDLHSIPGTGPEGRIVETDILNQINNQPKQRRILIIGAGDGGEVVANILLNNKNNEIIGFLDDNSLLWGKTILDKPILGGIELLGQLKDKFDSTIISITSNMQIRKEIYDKLKEKNCHLINAIHPQAYLNPTAKIGEGNIICAFVHLGHQAVINNNNLISAHSSIEHHNQVGCHNLFGPGVKTSGRVTIGNGCSLGAGVNIEPHVTIGNRTAIASGSTIIQDVPDNTIIKKEIKRKA